jgi:hypothetical protein
MLRGNWWNVLLRSFSPPAQLSLMLRRPFDVNDTDNGKKIPPKNGFSLGILLSLSLARSAVYFHIK